MPAARREGPEPVLEIEGRRARSEQAICSEHSQPPSMGALRGWVQGADRPPLRQLPSAWGRLRGWAGSGWAARRQALPGSRFGGARAERHVRIHPNPAPEGLRMTWLGSPSWQGCRLKTMVVQEIGTSPQVELQSRRSRIDSVPRSLAAARTLGFSVCWFRQSSLVSAQQALGRLLERAQQT